MSQICATEDCNNIVSDSRRKYCSDVCAARQRQRNHRLRVRKQSTVVVSGYFNPLHEGHIQYIKAAKALGDYLVVIVNNDEQVCLKGSYPLMTVGERAAIVAELKSVDKVVISIDEDLTVCKTVEALHPCPTIFANGGDRGEEDVPEKGICDKLGITMVFGVGGDKIQSSSEICKRIRE